MELRERFRQREKLNCNAGKELANSLGSSGDNCPSGIRHQMEESLPLYFGLDQLLHLGHLRQGEIWGEVAL